MHQPDLLEESIRHCVGISRRTATNFHYAFLTLSREKYRAMCVLYAFMRLTDDLADDTIRPLIDRQNSLLACSRQIEKLKTPLQVLNNQPDRSLGQHDDQLAGTPLLPALTDLINRYQIPTENLQDVIKGVTRDLTPNPIQSQADLEDYCYHVAGVVGLCCISIWGYDQSESARHAAIACGKAFQLTNILRDVREDAEQGRCYLPVDQLRSAGLTPETLLVSPENQLTEFLKQQITIAQEYYRQAVCLLDHLQDDGQRIYISMLRIYGGLLEKIDQNPLAVLQKRISLSKSYKLYIASQGFFLFRTQSSLRLLPQWMRSAPMVVESSSAIRRHPEQSASI